MNASNFSVAEALVPSSYIRQARDAKTSRENQARQLLEQVLLPARKSGNIVKM